MTQEHTAIGYFWEPAERGRLCVIRFKAPHYTGGGEVVARHVELELAKTICSALNSYASSQAEIARLREALQAAAELHSQSRPDIIQDVVDIARAALSEGK